MHIDGISDDNFQQAYLSALAVLDQMNQLLIGMRHVPLTTPVSGPDFERTSGFGPRVDPFTGHYAFHPGLDFAGPWGATVRSTAPGTVVYAGARGTYGNMVEIDHGYGIPHTLRTSVSIWFVLALRCQKARPSENSDRRAEVPDRTCITKCGTTMS